MKPNDTAPLAASATTGVTAGITSAPRFSIKLGVVAILTGIGSGLGGMLLALLLHKIQHMAYGYSLDFTIGTESFLVGVTHASAQRRLFVLMGCGLVAGLGWWLIYRFGKPIVSVKQTVDSDTRPMPPGTTIAHAVLQIVTVALGSPLGREVAPREIGALFASWLSARTGLTSEQRRMIVACGAGAGLAAVYNVPLGGAVFTMEVLLITFSWQAACLAMATSAIAAGVAWLGIGAEMQYVVPTFLPTASLVVWALICGPLFGLAGHAFIQFTNVARSRPARGWRLPVYAFVNFTIIGVLAMYFPQLLGNGKGAAQLAFDSHVAIGLAATLLVLKVLIVAGSLRAGASGGLLTPALANGALMAIVLGGLWSYAWPGVPLGAFALVGAAAFLATSQRMPLTAVVLVAEFTQVNHNFLVPMILAVAGSVMASRVWESRGLGK